MVPAFLYVLVNLGPDGRPGGWAVPVATDIAFALAVLAVVGDTLPTALRAFLLSLAVVDDLLAILVIAVFFTRRLDVEALGGARRPARLVRVPPAPAGARRGVRPLGLAVGWCTKRACTPRSPASRSVC